MSIKTNIYGSLLSSLLLFGCGESVTTQVEYVDYRGLFSIEEEMLTIEASSEGSTHEVDVVASEYVSWRVVNSSIPDWVELGFSQSFGSGTMTFEVEAHKPAYIDGEFEDADGITATIEIEGYYNRVAIGSYEIELTQPCRGAYIYAPEVMESSSSGSIIINELDFQTNIACADPTIVCDGDEWLALHTINDAYGDSNADRAGTWQTRIVFNAEENTTGEDREATITIRASDTSLYPRLATTFTFKQLAQN